MNLPKISDGHLQSLTEVPGLEAVLREAKEHAKKRPGEWVACPQLLSFREWFRIFVGLRVKPHEPQLAVMWRPQNHQWHVVLAGLVEGLEDTFEPREHRFRFPRLMVDYYLQERA